MRAIILFIAVPLLNACDRQPIYSVLPVSPADIRNALPETKAGKATTIHAADGRSGRVDWTTHVELSGEPAHDPATVSMWQLGWSCAPTRTDPAFACELDGRKANANVLATTGRYTHRPEWEDIGRYTVITALVGGAVAGEVYCFAECDSGGKVALAVTDVAVPLVAVVVVCVFIAVGLGNGG